MATDLKPTLDSAQTGTIGLIGLGLLGSAIGTRLRQAGFTTVGFDIDERRRDEFRDHGGIAVSSAGEAAGKRLILCLPDSTTAAQVLRDLDPALESGSIVIDLTTGNPGDAEQNCHRLAEKHVGYLDATVGGSSKQTLAGDVIVMAGGDAAVFEQCGKVFAAYAREVFYLGPAGSGARMKLVLNLALGLNRAVLAESLSFARALGIDPQRALAVLRAGPAHSDAMDIKGLKMVNEDFTAEARLSQHLKDVRLIVDSARETGARVPLTEVHRRLLEEAESRGYGAADNSAIIKVFQDN